jgi:hypothetical protein
MIKTGNSNAKAQPDSNSKSNNAMSNLADFEKFRSGFDTNNKSDKKQYDRAYQESMNLSNYLDNKKPENSQPTKDRNNMFSIG